MAQQIVIPGTGPNTGTGETPYAFAVKVKDNFAELYGSATLHPDTSANVSVGFTATASALGTPSASSTVTLNAATRAYFTLTNNAAFTLDPPSPTSPADSASGVALVTNGASAGAITLTGWTSVNDPLLLTTTNTHKFALFYTVIAGSSILDIRPLQ
jgi:hypothetical protein